MSLEVKLNLGYKMHKRIKKLYGQNLGREIAVGRKLVKLIKERYELNPHTDAHIHVRGRKEH